MTLTTRPTPAEPSLRDEILRAFLNTNGYLSGEVLSQQLQVSRTAVWKHIRDLEQIGFQFDAAHRRGYRLTHAPNVVLGPLLEDHLLPGTMLGRQVVYIPEVDSTNRYAAELVQHGAAHGTVVTASVQTGGKGRRGRVWFSPAEGLWFSTIIRRPIPLARAAELTLLASVAVRRAIARLTALPVEIKWPNDLLLYGRKICGILAEVRADGEDLEHAIVGIGINTNIPSDTFPETLRDVATSVVAEGGPEISHPALAGAILSEMDPLFEELAAGGSGFAACRDEWKTHSYTLHRDVRVQTPQGILAGRAVDIDVVGVLTLELPNGDHVRIQSGEVLF